VKPLFFINIFGLTIASVAAMAITFNTVHVSLNFVLFDIPLGLFAISEAGATDFFTPALANSTIPQFGIRVVKTA
jgi:hypothetical protein